MLRATDIGTSAQKCTEPPFLVVSNFSMLIAEREAEHLAYAHIAHLGTVRDACLKIATSLRVVQRKRHEVVERVCALQRRLHKVDASV